jgi:polysaccharide biosynthesis protein PslG
MRLCMVLLAALCLAASASDPAPVRHRAFYGINADPVWDFKADGPAQFAEMLKQTGCGAVRIPIRWRVLEPRKGEWDFSAVDRAVQSIPEDVEILGTLMSVPEWANGMDPKKAEGWFDTYPPRDVVDWARAVASIVNHYRHRLKHWEIWNEENGVDFFRPRPDARAYTALLKAAYQAAKKADPSCVVVLGGLQMNGILANPWSEVKVTNYLEELYKAGARPYFDVCNTHPYVLPEEGAARMIEITRDTLALMDRYGDSSKPLWITEVGCGATSSEGEQAQARLLRETFALAAREPRIHRVFWFLLRDMEKDLLGPESTMGLFKYNGMARPALDAFRRP